MTDVWNSYVVKRFKSIPTNPRESDFHAPYDKLLNTEFHTDGRFTVAPQTHPICERKEAICFVVEYTVEIDDKPVLVLEIKEPQGLNLLSVRANADTQLRTRLSDIAYLCPLPKLYGISAFGTKIAFYEYDKQTDIISPHLVNTDPVRVNDVAPSIRWADDIMENQGARKLKNLFQDIISQCEIIE